MSSSAGVVFGRLDMHPSLQNTLSGRAAAEGFFPKLPRATRVTSASRGRSGCILFPKTCTDNSFPRKLAPAQVFYKKSLFVKSLCRRRFWQGAPPLTLVCKDNLSGARHRRGLSPSAAARPGIHIESLTGHEWGADKISYCR
jgi:hypothetical protein